MIWERKGKEAEGKKSEVVVQEENLAVVVVYLDGHKQRVLPKKGGV